MIIGDWCPSYLERLQHKYEKGKISEEKYNKTKEFIQRKIHNINQVHKNYEKMSIEDKKKYRKKIEDLKTEMSVYFLKMINGRINSFRLRSTLKNYDDINDIIQDAYITIITYINRYNDEMATSAFAYVTQLATNSILYSLNKIKENEEKYVSGLDFYENLNTIDNPHDLSNLTKGLE